MKDNTEVGVFLNWASTVGEQHFPSFILPTWLVCLPYIDRLSTLLLVVCVPSLTESLSPIISPDQLFLGPFGTTLFCMHNFCYVSITAGAPK